MLLLSLLCRYLTGVETFPIFVKSGVDQQVVACVYTPHHAAVSDLLLYIHTYIDIRCALFCCCVAGMYAAAARYLADGRSGQRPSNQRG